MEACGGRQSGKIKPVRDYDVYYDSVLCFSSQKDYTREVQKAAAAASTFTVRPCYQTMFSDTRPRNKLTVIPSAWASRIVEEHSLLDSPLDPKCTSVLGSRRPLFFKEPIQKKPTSSKEQVTKETAIIGDFTSSAQPLMTGTAQMVSKSIQTDYRDSSTQTDAWAHDVIALQGLDLLQLGWLSFDNEKSVCERDVSLIERQWQKHAWDNVLPDLRLIGNWRRVMMTDAMAANDTAARELDVDFENEQRILLATQKLASRIVNHRKNLSDRLQRFIILLRENSAENVSYLKNQLQRRLRKLNMKQRGVEMKYKSRFQKDVLTELVNEASDVHAPQLRYGEPLARREIAQVLCRHLSEFRGLEIVEKSMIQSPGIRSGFNFEVSARPKKDFCKRSALRAEKELNLRENYKGVSVLNMGAEERKSPSPLKMRDSIYIETPSGDDETDDLAEEQLQHGSLLRRIVRGRATQTMM